MSCCYGCGFRRCLRSCLPWLGCSGPTALPCVDRCAHPGLTAEQPTPEIPPPFGSVPSGPRCSPRGGGGPAVSARLQRRLCSLHSNFSSCELPARSRNRSEKDRRSRAHRSHPCGAESRGLGYATGSPRHSAGSAPAALGRAGRQQVGDPRPREMTPREPPLPSVQPRGTRAEACLVLMGNGFGPVFCLVILRLLLLSPSHPVLQEGLSFSQMMNFSARSLLP